MSFYAVFNPDLFHTWPLTLHVSANTQLLFSQASLSLSQIMSLVFGEEFILAYMSFFQIQSKSGFVCWFRKGTEVFVWCEQLWWRPAGLV